MAPSRYCEECGDPLGEGAKFCPGCGHPVSLAGETAAVPEPPAPPGPSASPGPPQPPGPPSGPPPVLPAGPSPGGAGSGGGRNQKVIVGLLAALVLAVAAVAVALFMGGGDGDEKASKQDREVLLESTVGAGPAPFTPDLVPVSATSPTTVTTTAPPPTTAGPGGRVAQGPFGGTGDNTVCDRELLVSFLTDPANASIAREWARVLDVRVADIPAYVRALIPTTLTADARVTNHRWENGRAVGYQAVLQAGTAVLVDTNGRLIARCRCGNPLRPPQEVSKPVYSGPKWQGFDPAVVVVVVPSPTPVYPPGGVGTLPADTSSTTAPAVTGKAEDAIARIKKAYEECARKTSAIRDGLITAAQVEQVLGEATYTATPVDRAAGIYRVTQTLQSIGPFPPGGAVIVGQSLTWEVDLRTGTVVPVGGASQYLPLSDACGGAALSTGGSTTTTPAAVGSPDEAIRRISEHFEPCAGAYLAQQGWDSSTVDAIVTSAQYTATLVDEATGTYRVAASFAAQEDAGSATWDVNLLTGEITPVDESAAFVAGYCPALA